MKILVAVHDSQREGEDRATTSESEDHFVCFDTPTEKCTCFSTKTMNKLKIIDNPFDFSTLFTFSQRDKGALKVAYCR